MVCEMFLFGLDLELFIKSVKKPGLSKFLQITQDLNEIKKISHTLL